MTAEQNAITRWVNFEVAEGDKCGPDWLVVAARCRVAGRAVATVSRCGSVNVSRATDATQKTVKDEPRWLSHSSFVAPSWCPGHSELPRLMDFIYS